jgi:hypothetical protein
MKAIILISSIFYVLGLKISNKIDFVKRINPVEKIINNVIPPKKTDKVYRFHDDAEKKPEADTLKCSTPAESQILEKK